MLTFVQTSDIHFRETENDRHDLDYELRHALVEDARRLAPQIGGVSGILVCGDVAYAASAGEYSRATLWLRGLCADLALDPSDVWVVPGNHDVEHSRIQKDPLQRALHSELRLAEEDDLDERLRDILEDSERGEALFLPIENYMDFAAQYGCEVSRQEPFWEELHEIDDDWRLCLRGITSTLISDEEDDKRKNRLVVGNMQAMVLPQLRVVHLTLCHHPECWLRDGRSVRGRLDPTVCMQITGHMHRHVLRETGAGYHLAAGALHPQRPHSDDFRPRYNFVSIAVDRSAARPELVLSVRARVWEESETARRFVPDGDGSTERRLPLEEEIEVGPSEEGAATEQEAPAVARKIGDPRRRLSHRFSLLSHPRDRLKALERAGAAVGLFADIPATRLPLVALKWAEDADSLPALWNAVEDSLGKGQLGAENPFGQGDRDD